MINWSKSDHYAETRSMPKYTIQKRIQLSGSPPPAYGDAVGTILENDPSWVMDSSNQFHPLLMCRTVRGEEQRFLQGGHGGVRYQQKPG